jgi:hypothetical protein
MVTQCNIDSGPCDYTLWTGAADFLVIDRGADSADCVEHFFEEAQWRTVTV